MGEQQVHGGPGDVVPVQQVAGHQVEEGETQGEGRQEVEEGQEEVGELGKQRWTDIYIQTCKRCLTQFANIVQYSTKCEIKTIVNKNLTL